MPPAPIGPPISYGPSRVPGGRGMALPVPGLPAERAVPARLAVGLPARDAVHPPAGVRGARAVVQALDRRAIVGVAGGGPQVEELIDRQLAVKDVPPDETQVPLHVVGADH